MLNRDPEREAPRPSTPPKRGRWQGALHPSVNDGGISLFRRAYRWLNLTLVQHGVWPLLIVVAGAPTVPIGLTPLPWYWARLGGPLLATLLALAYLSQRPEGLPSDRQLRTEQARTERDQKIREQVVILIVGVAAAVAVLRLLQGPLLPVIKLEAFGLADVAAYQAINFSLINRGALGNGRFLPIGLFGLSWGLHDLFLSATSPVSGNLLLIFLSGAAIGAVVGAVSWALRRWPGGYLSAVALQFLFVYLVLGYLP